MKKAIVSIFVLAVVVLGTVYAQEASQNAGTKHARYSDASLNGNYFFSDRSSGAIGTFVFDGKGNYTGGSFPAGQEVFGCTSPFSGTYSVNPDGSGTGTFSCPGISNSIALAVTQDGGSFVVSGGAVSNIAVRQ